MQDNYGRSVAVTTADGVDTYTVTDTNGEWFTVAVPTGTPQDQVMGTINAMAPQSPPDSE
jgi:hypothetical protein